jgi:cytochrome c-type biogenesis protein CcmH
MMIWTVFALMTGAAVMAVLWPLSRRPAADEDGPDAPFYREQMAEIERDLERGLLSPAEAEAARIEAGRRLLRAMPAGRAASDMVGEPALRRRRAASAVALSAVPLLALALYGAYGSPSLPGQPLSARLQADPQALDMAAAVAHVEAHLAQHPEDGRGWEVIAPVYLRLGRVDEAVKAYATALRLLGEDAARLTNYGEALVQASDGMVSADARAAFGRAASLDPGLAKAHYYLALAAEQDGDHAAARSHYATILSSSPPDAPWAPLVKERLARLGGEAAQAVAALPAPERNAAIKGMVEGLAARLDAQGGTPDEWGRLIRSYVVLGEREKAEAALDRARRSLGQDAAARRQVDAAAQALGLTAGADRQPAEGAQPADVRPQLARESRR